MKTIIKGKHMKYEYSVVSYLDLRLYLYKPIHIFCYDWYDDNKRIKQLNDRIDDLKNQLIELEQFDIEKYIDIRKTVISYETFCVYENLDFLLHDNNELYIEENVYKIEKVVGTDKNQIIYYVNKELSIEDNPEQYKEVETEIKRKIDAKISELESYIKQYQQDIQCIIEQNNSKREGEYNESLKENNNKESWIKRVMRKIYKD